MGILTGAILMAALGGCGGGHAGGAPPPGPLRGASDRTPQAAVVGFLEGLPKGPSGACLFVTPTELIACGQAFTTTVGFSASDLSIGAVSIQGSQALVTVTGKICATVNGKTT